MKLLHFVTLPFCLLLNVRCSDIEYKSPSGGVGNENPISEERVKAKNDVLKVKIEGLSEINKFLVKVSVQNLHSDFVVERISKDYKRTAFALNQNEISDSDIIAGETYTYTVKEKINSNFVKVSEEKIEIPKDLVVTGINETKEKLNLKNFRLFLTKNAVFKLNEQDANIEFEEIHSENGKIITFFEKDSGPLGTDGRSTGDINIKAKKITGPLKIEIRGEAGGQGLKGATGNQGPQGEPNKRLINEGFLLSSTPDLCRREYYNPERFGGLSYEDFRIKYHPGVGGPGGPGSPGLQGLQGARGGNVGNITLEIPLSNEIEIVYTEGAPGKGGEGGDGGPGGYGGAGAGSANISPGMPCDTSPSGPTGPVGPKGPIGPDGTKGNKAKLVINGELK